MATGRETLQPIAGVTGIPTPIVARYTRALRETQPKLFATAPRGGGESSEQVTPHYLVNAILALAAPAGPEMRDPIPAAGGTVLEFRGLMPYRDDGAKKDEKKRFPGVYKELAGKTFGEMLEMRVDEIAHGGWSDGLTFEVVVARDTLHAPFGTLMLHHSLKAEGILFAREVHYGAPQPPEGDGTKSSLAHPGALRRNTVIPFPVWKALADLWRDSLRKTAPARSGIRHRQELTEEQRMERRAAARARFHAGTKERALGKRRMLPHRHQKP